MLTINPEKRIRFWQWPNVLALDAALIAIAWQAAVTLTYGVTIGMPERLVLGLSVWLTYVADRLFDVRHRNASDLLSVRHQFAKRNANRLWPLWWIILILNVSLAATSLSSAQLYSGLVLLFCCLIYTALNQLLSKRFFPKELCVALIFAGGVLLFISNAYDWVLFIHLSCLYLLNCLQISRNERTIDAALRVRSLAFSGSLHIWLIIGVFLASSIHIAAELLSLMLLSGFSALGLAIVHHYRKKTPLELFRVLADLALLIGPGSYAIGALLQ